PVDVDGRPVDDVAPICRQAFVAVTGEFTAAHDEAEIRARALLPRLNDAVREGNRDVVNYCELSVHFPPGRATVGPRVRATDLPPWVPTSRLCSAAPARSARPSR